MFPWSIRVVTDLPREANLGKVQQNVHRLAPLIRIATPDVPYQTVVPEISKGSINDCSIHANHCTNVAGTPGYPIWGGL